MTVHYITNTDLRYITNPVGGLFQQYIPNGVEEGGVVCGFGHVSAASAECRISAGSARAQVRAASAVGSASAASAAGSIAAASATVTITTC